jgi:hypothetical protein
MVLAMDIHLHPMVHQFRVAAERFCQLLEVKPDNANHWTEKVLTALARLYAAGHALPDGSTSDNAPDLKAFRVEDEEWQRVYSLVHEILGSQSGYWAYFDPSEPPTSGDEAIFGDLGDDLADIYRDIKPGLRAWEAGLEQYVADIVFDWKCVFSSHWGVHAVSAMRALHPLAHLRGVQRSQEPVV